MCALRFVDSFDHYTTLTQKWTSVFGAPTVVAAAARTGVCGLRFNDATHNATLTLDAQGTWIIGVACRLSSIAGGAQYIQSTRDGGAVQGVLRLNTDGTLSLLRAATVVATSARSIRNNVWYYIEFKHIIDNAAGTLEVRVDGEVWATFNGDTQNTVNPTANQIRLCGAGAVASGNEDFDDLYILDGTGAINNNYLGNSQVEAIVPNGIGNYTEWLTLFGAASHWQAENEVPPNEDVSYVADLVLNSRDTYTYGNILPAAATLPGIQVLMRAKQVLAGVANIARLYRNAAADYQGADALLTVNYAYLREIMELDPNAGPGAWAVAAVNSAEFGARVR